MGQYLKMNVVIPEQYIEGFVRANNTFLYQLVFDPVRRKVVPLNPYLEHIDPASLGYAGLYPLALVFLGGHLVIYNLEKGTSSSISCTVFVILDDIDIQ